MAGKGSIPSEVRVFIVTALACFDTPGTVKEAVKKEFGLDLSPQSIEAYDPTKRAGRNLAATWREIFETARAGFLNDTSGIGISHRSVRLRTLQRMATKAEEMKNLPLAAQLLEQAAKEIGNAFTNRREHTGKDGGAIQTESTARLDLTGMTQAERDVFRGLLVRRAGESENSAP